jgi:repressor LexA
MEGDASKMTAMDLTKGQRRLLEYLRQKISENGQAPTLRESASDMGVSHAAVAQMLKTLETKGYIQRDGRYGRNLYLIDKTQSAAGIHRWKEIPVIGRIVAGLPMYAQQEWEGTLVLDAVVFPGSHLFALRVQGDSMKDAAILDGDLAICEPRQYARNGEIVTALIRQEEATIKRFFIFEDHIELRPENTRYPVMHYDFGEVLVQGKVVGIQRGPDQIGQRHRS